MALTPNGKHFAFNINAKGDDVCLKYMRACEDCIQFLKTLYFQDPSVLASDSSEVKKTKNFLFAQKRRKNLFDIAEGYIGKLFGLFDKDLPIYSLDSDDKWSVLNEVENWLVQELDIDVSLL